jgi:hypothetical protein
MFHGGMYWSSRHVSYDLHPEMNNRLEFLQPIQMNNKRSILLMKKNQFLTPGHHSLKISEVNFILISNILINYIPKIYSTLGIYHISQWDKW